MNLPPLPVSFLPVMLLSLLAAPASADEAALKKALAVHFPNEKIESVKKTPYLGLYEVVIGSELLYTDAKATHLFFGHVVDPRTRTSLTSERLQQIKDARRISLDSLPLEHAIKAVKGNGARRLAVFSDPNCPYCKGLEKELAKITDVTIYTLLYPILNGSLPTATAIWCSPDPLGAWNDFMLRDVAPPGKSCPTPLDGLIETGRRHDINGTPTLIFADGSIVSGMMPADAIEKKLNQGTAPR